MGEHPKEFPHVGLLFNESSAAADYPLFSRPTTLQPAILPRRFASYNDRIYAPTRSIYREIAAKTAKTGNERTNFSD